MKKNLKWINVLCLAAAALLVLSCMGRELVRIDPKTQSFVLEDIPVQTFVGVDILVVVDNSGSMAAEQSMLRDAFPNLITSILTGTDPVTGAQVHAPVRDLHIGVVSTDMGVGGYNVQTCETDPLIGDDGVLQHTPHGTGCSTAYPTYLSYFIDPTTEPDLGQVNQLATDFGCIAVLGTSGCGFEQQLEAAKKALIDHSQPGGANAGFLRDNTILTVLFVTDEEDCSAADPTLFDISALPYSINLQCYYQAVKLRAVDEYFRQLKSLRGDPDSPEVSENLVVGFIVGVPPGEPACEGGGDMIAGCLDLPGMAEVVRPDGELLEYVCKYPAACTPPDPPYPGDCIAEAFPARRFVQLAQAFGDNAVVQSICTDSFVPAVSALTEKLRDAINAQVFRRQLEVTKDPLNDCRCLATCVIIEELSDNRACPDYDGDGMPNIYDANGDTIGDVNIDEATGQATSLCEVPQAGSIISNCALACDDPEAVHTKDPNYTGWWYNPWGVTGVDSNGDTVPDLGPVVNFEGVEPEGGSGVAIQCASTVCPAERLCGMAPTYASKCCDVNEYCLYTGDPKTTEGYCLVRQDICEEYGNDVWCPGIGPVAAQIGGLCCLDHDTDGNLDWVYEAETNLPDYPSHYCAGAQCVPR
jgi:hypothetical protein